MGRVAAVSLVCLLAVGGIEPVSAYPRMVFEHEPNDTREQAQAFRGAAQLSGEVLDDDQDWFRWSLDEADVDQRWRLELQGRGDIRAELIQASDEPVAAEAGVATFGGGVSSFAAAAPDDEPDLQADEPHGESRRELLTLSTSARSPRQLSEPLLIPAGEHWIRFHTEGAGGDYQLTLSAADRVNIRGTLSTERSDRVTVTPGRQWFFQLDVAEAVIPLIGEGEAQQLWRLALSAELGASLDAWIEDAAGNVLAETREASPLQQQWAQLALPEEATLHLRHTQGEAIGRLGATLAEDGWQPSPVAQTAVPEPGESTAVEELASNPGQRLWLVPGEEATFQVAQNHIRYLGFRVTEDEPPLRISVAAEGEAAWQVWLSSLDTGDEVLREGTHEGLFSQMQLPPGDYGVRVRRHGRDTTQALAMTFALHEDDPLSTGWVNWPADNDSWAFPLEADEPIRGRFDQSGEAWFELQVSGSAQQWRFTTDAETPLSRLSLFRAGERSPLVNRTQSRRDPQPLWLENVRLLPGRYHIRLSGEDTDYQLLASPQGRPEPGLEIEPNDQDAEANPLWLGEPVHGSFHSHDDVDRFHFHLPGWNRVALEIEPPEGGEMGAQLEWQGERLLTMSAAHQPDTMSHLLPPGDYVLVLQGERASPEPYRVTLSLVDPWMPQGVVLPVAQRDQAPLLPESGLLTRRFGSHGGYLRLPVSVENREVEFKGRLHATGDTHATTIELLTGQGQRLDIEEIGREHYRAFIPGGEPVWLKVSFGRYASDVVIDDPAYPQPAASSLDIELASNTHRVAAFIAEGQRVSSPLVIKNPGSAVQRVSLAAHISHTGGSVEGLPDELTLEPDERLELDLEWALPAGLLENAEVSLFVRAGEQVAEHRLQPVSGAPVVDPVVVPELPESLQGLADLAWSALGATFVAADSGEPLDELPQQRRSHAHFLIDGMAAAGSSIEVQSELGEALPPIRLAGDGGQVHGVAFNQRSSHAYGNRWREVEIAMGESYQDLEAVMRVELASTDGELFFLLDEPRQASHIQLRPLSVWGDPTISNRLHGTGLLRVLGEPTGELAERRHDLLDRALGGHWVYTLPHLDTLQGLQGERFTNRGVMDERQVRRGESIRGRRVEMVFAFLQQRAARIDRLRWEENLEWAGLPVERARVYTATESPVGPWQLQTEWLLERDADGVAELVLEKMPRARYLRLAFDEPEAGEGRDERNWRIPAKLAAFEADTLGSGRSILGHWGMDHSRGPLEAARGIEAQPLHRVEDDHSQADAPWELRERVTGRVEEPGDTRHYQLLLAEGDNTLSLALEESQRGRLQVMLHDPEGQKVALRWRDQEGIQRIAEALDLVPGEYHLSVAEPPRSVVFLWDGSGSVASHQPTIYQALNRFAEGLESGREVFNMLPLGGPLLIDGWAESPSQVVATLAAYDNRFTGSDSEPALRAATRALERQPGERAIFLITDAEQVNRDLSVWQDLARVQPRIFTLEIAHGNRVETEASRWYQHQMLGWAQVGNGFYRYATGRSDLVRAFEEGMLMLRRPTTFALAVESRYQEPPEPGSLRVVSGDEPVVAAGAVHLIFDASGSMLRQMGGGRRIEVARRIVQQALDERIPDSVPVALRAFGHTEPHSCATELLVAPGEHNHAEVRQAVGGIQAVNLARTALADSLDAVLDDLVDYAGQRRLVVMLTDGEETCEGDLEQSVSALVAEGVDVRLNIVGFHIDELGLQAEFERFAELGGGEYFDSHDGDQLVEGLVNALAAPWRVVDGHGEIVARGRVDDEAPVELEAGVYELVVETRQGEYRRQIEMTPRAALQLKVGGSHDDSQ